MNRRKARENTFIALFESSFGGEMPEIIQYSREEAGEYQVDEFGEGLLVQYAAHTDEVENAIETRLKGWKVNRLPRVSLAVLRLAVTEMLYSDEEMDSVAINEAVEISKKFGDEGDYQFINGILGSISREKSPERANALIPEVENQA